MGWEVLEGDCVEQMAAMPARSVDAVVCDPPYGLEFMGKEWDRLEGPQWGANAERWTERPKGGTDPFENVRPRFGTSPMRMQEWHEAWAREALRVLKPGGHLLAFGGTRTYHRLVCAVEDAGFEIRDTITWMYGSGFPKSLDVSKAIDKRKDWTALPKMQAAIRTAREELGISQSEAACRMGLIAEGESLGGGGFMWFESGMRVPTREQWPELKAALGLGDDHDGAFEAAERESLGEYGEDRMPGGFGDHRFSAVDRSISSPLSENGQRWQGWGTALKPAHEPVVVARKPLAGTVAQTVLEHGTGAINIDTCRVGTDVRHDSANRANGPWSSSYEGSLPGGCPGRPPLPTTYEGRWPPNVVLSHSEGCVPAGTRRVKSGTAFEPENGRDMHRSIYGAMKSLGRVQGYADSDGMETVTAWECVEGCPVRMLDEQTGPLPGGTPRTDEHGATGSGATFISGKGHNGFGDQGGGASRFFPTFSHRPEPGFLYQAKASSAERNAGLDGFEEKATRDTYGDGLQGPRPHTAPDYEWQRKGARNTHPTVKPIDLMRWLVRLVTPPNGIVLDPFTGSGTTGAAAVLEGFDFVGIERDPEYLPIARARIQWWSEHPEGMELVKRLEAESTRKEVAASGQGSFFDLLDE